MSAPTTTASAAFAAVRAQRDGGTGALWLAGLYYLVAALVVTMWLWRDPASRVVAANPYDSDQFAWFFRYDASAVAHLRLPALSTAGMNAPQGINLNGQSGRGRAGHECGRPDFCCRGLGEADVQEEVSEPQVQGPAARPVHDERQEDDDQDDHHQPEEEHDNPGNCVPGYSSRSCHGPTATRLIPTYSLMPDRSASPPRYGRFKIMLCRARPGGLDRA